MFPGGLEIGYAEFRPGRARYSTPAFHPLLLRTDDPDDGRIIQSQVDEFERALAEP
jgi:hypothetical protein